MALSLDGHNCAAATAGTQAASLTTTAGSGVIIALTFGGSGNGGNTSVTATGLTFTKYMTSGPDGSGNTYEVWWAPYTSNFSNTITANWLNATAITNLTVFGIGGADTSSPFDANGSSNSGSPSITTTTANTFIFSCQGDGFTPAAGGSFALIDPAGPAFYSTNEYQIVSATQSGLVAAITGTSSGGLVAAVKQASASVATILGFTPGTIFTPGGRGRGPSRGLSRLQAFPSAPAYSQTVSVNSTTSVSFTKGVGKSIAATCTAAVSMVKAVAKQMAVASSSAVSLAKSVAKQIAVTAATSTTASGAFSAFAAGVQVGMSQGFLFHPGRGPMWDKRRQAFPPASTATLFNQTVTVSATTTTTTVKSTAHIIGVLCGATVSLAKSTGKLVAATCSGAVTYTKSTAHTVAVTCSTSTTANAIRVFLKTITVGCSTTVTLTRQAGKVIAVSCGSAVSGAKAVGKQVAVTCVGAVSATKGVAKSISVACLSVLSLIASYISNPSGVKIRTLTVTVRSGSIVASITE